VKSPCLFIIAWQKNQGTQDSKKKSCPKIGGDQTQLDDWMGVGDFEGFLLE